MGAYVDLEKAGGIRGQRLFAPGRDYSILQGDGNYASQSVGGKVRRQEFGGSKPIVWGDGACGLSTVQWTPVGGPTNTRNSSSIESTYPNGEAGHWALSTVLGVPSWRIAYNTGEDLTAGTCRCQMSGYPTQAGLFAVDMEVQFGDATDNWALTTAGTKAVLIWQLKPTSGQPVWSINIDTDSTDATKLEMSLSRKATAAGSVVNAGRKRGLARHTRITTRIEALLSYATNGWITWWVNGEPIYAADGIATLQPDTSTYFQPIFGLYMFQDVDPLTAPTRVLHLIRHRLHSGVLQPTSTGVALSNPRRLANYFLGA